MRIREFAQTRVHYPHREFYDILPSAKTCLTMLPVASTDALPDFSIRKRPNFTPFLESSTAEREEGYEDVQRPRIPLKS